MKKNRYLALIAALTLTGSLIAGCGSTGSSSASSSAASSSSETDSSFADSQTDVVSEEADATASAADTAESDSTEEASTEDAASTDDTSSSEIGTITTSEVHIAIQPSGAFIPLFIDRELGYIEDALKEYNVDVTWNDFESGPPMNESLASGDSDFGVIGDVPTVSSIAAGQDNKVIATAAKAADSYAVLVAADSDIATAADLKGKKVATVIGSTGHNLTSKFLATDDLTIDDIELVNISVGDAATVLSQGDVDAVSIWEPNVTRLVNEGIGKVIALGSDVGLAGTNTIVARREFAEANPGIVEILLQQYARAAKELADGEIDDDTLTKVAEDLSLDLDSLKAIIPKYQFTVIPDQEDVDALNDTINFLAGIDAISEAYDISEYVDASYAEDAGVADILK